MVEPPVVITVEPPAPDGWQDDAHQLWLQGRRQAAIDRLLERINALAPAVPRPLGLQLVYYVFLLGDLINAEKFLRQWLKVHPDDPEILVNLGAMISRQGGRDDEAMPVFARACQLQPNSANAWDGLALAFSRASRHQEAQEAGERSLSLKTAAASPLPNWAPPAVTPQSFLQRPRQADRCDCISFSIWGSNPRHLRGALRNALLIPELYPGWRARFHLDASVPEEFIALLQSLGAELRPMPAGQTMRQKLSWRFLVANDPGVGRFLVRDCDSVVSQREVHAVQQWLASDRWFHVMRDWWTHIDPIPAGLWGGIAGVLPDLQTLFAGYAPPARETAATDRWFLRDVLWGSIRPHALIHDRCYRSDASQPWPEPDPAGNVHVGEDEFAVRRTQQANWLRAWIRRTPCLQLADDEPIGAGSKTPPKLLQPCIIRSWPGPLPDAPTPMASGVSGRIINLDGAVERWRRMETQIQSLGWSESHRRQPALTAGAEEARALGLRNGGELGLWRTTTALLEEWLAARPAAGDVLHILEDDAILHPNLPVLIERLREQAPPLDILFSEAFLTPSLYRRFRSLERKRQSDGHAILLLNGGQYLAGATSYLLSRDGARRLSQLLREREATGRLVPIDMAFRQGIRDGHLDASISLPFFSTITAGITSTIQHDRSAVVHLSQNADLSLRRLLYLLAWEPQACGHVLQELGGLLGDGLTPQHVETLVLDMLETGRSEGFLTWY